MTQVKPGMSKYEVVDLLGPPLDYLGRGDLDSAQWWLYLGAPPGRETNIRLDNGVVTMARDKPYDGSNRRLPEHGWAQERMDGHLAKVAADPTFAELVRLPGWAPLCSPHVRDFVQNAHAASEPPDRLGRSARRFGELDVLVSYCELASLADLRPTYFANGYFPVLSRLIDDFGIRPRQYDLAHWIFGWTPDSGTIAHLAYVPATDVMMLMPWDLLSTEEQAGGTATS